MERDLSITVVDNARALKALAHPLRLDLLEAVRVHGTLTATEAAQIVGESPANCSWHLRQLATSGFLEEVPGATGRQRPWRRTAIGMQWPDTDPDPEVEAAAQALTNVFIDREVARIKQARSRRQPAGWEEASMATQSIAWLTAAELDALQEQIGGLLRAFSGRLTEPATRPPGARPVRIIALAAPDDDLRSPRSSADPST